MLKNLDTRLTRIGTFPLNDLLPLAEKHGFDSIAFPLWELESIEKAKEATRQLADTSLEWGLMPMDVDVMRECPDEAFDIDLETVKGQMDKAQAAGVKMYYNHVWPGSNERDWDANFEWCAKRIARVHQAASDHGLKFGLEFLGPKPLHDSFKYPFIRNLKDILSLANTVSSEVGVLLDTYHWYTSGTTLEDLDLLGSGDRVVGMHINDGWKGRSRDEQQDLERELPLETGVIDCVAVIRKMKELGYNRTVTVEPFEPAATRLKAMPLNDALKTVADSMKKVFSSAGVV